jgi:hypothetical protein
MPPRKNKTETAQVAAPVVVTAPATVTVECTAGAAGSAPAAPSARGGARTFRILTEGPHAVVALDGSPTPVFDGPATGKKSSDRRVVQAATPGQASKKAFTKLVRNVTSKNDPDRNLSYRFTIQEDGKDKVHTYQGARTLLAEQKSVTRKGKDGNDVTIPIKYDVKVSAHKDSSSGSASSGAAGAGGAAKAPTARKPRAPKAAAPAAEPAPVAVETAAPAAPKGKGRGKGKGAK